VCLEEVFLTIFHAVLVACAATFLGCLPNNFLAVNAGSKLGELKSFSDLYDYKIILAGVPPRCNAADGC